MCKIVYHDRRRTTKCHSLVHSRAMDVDTEMAEKSFPKVLGRKISNVWNKLVSYMFEPEDGECLAVLRVAFGK